MNKNARSVKVPESWNSEKLKAPIDVEEQMDTALKGGDKVEYLLRWGKPSKRPPSRLYKDKYDQVDWRN